MSCCTRESKVLQTEIEASEVFSCLVNERLSCKRDQVCPLLQELLTVAGIDVFGRSFISAVNCIGSNVCAMKPLHTYQDRVFVAAKYWSHVNESVNVCR